MSKSNFIRINGRLRGQQATATFNGKAACGDEGQFKESRVSLSNG